jgi:acetyltransferase-like isoleucine patch superfamily enzyme
VRETAKLLARAIATIVVFPAVVTFRVRRAFFGANRALEGSSQALALVPGLSGCYLRRAFLAKALAGCDSTATIEFGTLFSQADARIEANVYVGPRCHLGLVHLESDVLLGAGVHIPSGANTHDVSSLDEPIREQGGRRDLVRIRQGAWIGSAAVVMADVGRHAIVGAGAVVTTPIPDFAVAVGVPARVIRDRRLVRAQA